MHNILIILQTIFIIFNNSNANQLLNNACHSFGSYLIYPFSSNCYQFDDINMKIPDVIRKYAGTAEEHVVITEDGYILTMFRIPQPSNSSKGIILYQHPVFTYGGVWLKQGPLSQAIYFWKAGYDIWIANMRGTTYSMDHLTLKHSDHAYWDWSITEIGIYDMSAQCNYIRQLMNRKIIVVAHSLGTTASLIYGSEKSVEAAENVERFVLMSTAACFLHTKGFLKNLAEIYTMQPIIRVLILKILRLDSVFLFLPEVKPILKVLSRFLPFIPYLIYSRAQNIDGYSTVADPAFFNFDFFDYVETVSWKTLIHFFQLMDSECRFQYFDYGDEENLVYYNSTIPPMYRLEDFKVKILFMGGSADTLTPPLDAQYIMDTLLPTDLPTMMQVIDGMDHYDWASAKDRPHLFYHLLLEMLATT